MKIDQTVEVTGFDGLIGCGCKQGIKGPRGMLQLVQIMTDSLYRQIIDKNDDVQPPFEEGHNLQNLLMSGIMPYPQPEPAKCENEFVLQCG